MTLRRDQKSNAVHVSRPGFWGRLRQAIPPRHPTSAEVRVPQSIEPESAPTLARPIHRPIRRERAPIVSIVEGGGPLSAHPGLSLVAAPRLHDAMPPRRELAEGTDDAGRWITDLGLRRGVRVGPYEILRELGTGGMGVVFLAHDGRLQRRVALKFPRACAAHAKRQLRAEGRATAVCSHENVVVILDVGEFRGIPFLVLEHLDGQTLASLLKGAPRIAPSQAVAFILPVVRALGCAHRRGIIHLDVKPENLFVTATGLVKVLDFGIARMGADAGQLRLSVSATPGTKAYMSPEQWGVGSVVDHRSDLWAVGMVLFEMLAGANPLKSADTGVYWAVMELDNPMPSLRDAAPSIASGLAGIVDRCLRKRRAERFPSAESLWRALSQGEG